MLTRSSVQSNTNRSSGSGGGKKIDVCGLLETKLTLTKVACMHKFRLKSWQFGIHVQITSLVHQYSFTTTFIYGFNTIIAKRALWEDLRRWGTDLPWIFLGDFNSILSQDDKHNSDPVSNNEISDFRECCADLGIADLNFTGCHFTWTSGTIWTKIDRVMVNTHWFTLQPMAHVHFGTLGAFSDHSPASVQLGLRELHCKQNFKFFNMWAAHLTTLDHGYLWVSYVYYLQKKLKLLKGALKTLNNLHFSHILERLAIAEKNLNDTQLLLQNDRDNGHLLMLNKQQRLNLVNLKSVEKMFFSQKLKCDKGTRFFHSLMSQRHRRNHIPLILHSDGLPTTSVEEVGREFVTYYK
ncbi:hypothetical protein Peur_058662 [Populus x canadensis]